jgi:hypothetical protein
MTEADTATTDNAETTTTVAATETAKTETIVTADTTKTASETAAAETTAKTADTAAKPDWPDDWRDKIAGEDKDFRKRLDRFGSPLDVAKSFRALEAKMSSGEVKKALPKDATPEEAAAWRKDNGIPDTPGGYVEKLALPNGLVLGEADKPVVTEFATAAHALGMDTGHFAGLVAKYYEIQDKKAADQADADETFHNESLNALGTEWGAHMRREVNGVNSFVNQHFPGSLGRDLLIARDTEGRMLGDNPAFIKALASLNRELNPVSTLIPSASGDPAKGLADRMAEIQKMMPDRTSAYWKGPQAEALQQEYRDLITASEKMKARAA